jgi:phenylpropionate dioxygenase-like ring-hydroxylating dioxygenase large terminal subunit
MSSRDQFEAAYGREEIAGWIDSENGLIEKSIYVDQDIYEMELERLFARAWNFMCHESHLANAGDYLINYIGEDQVIVVRDNDGVIQVLLNTCAHRGNALCRAEIGNAKSFLCTYHGWNFGLDGKLLAVPGKEHFYRNKLEMEKWGLRKAAKVESYKGFYFATLDPDAPSLYDYLGEVGRIGIDQMTAHGEIVAVDGVQKNVIDCNWKIAVDNLFDWYHVNISHRSATKVGFVHASVMQPMQQMVMLGEYGHAISGPMISEEQQAELDKLSDEERVALDLLSLPERAKLAPRITERRPIRSKQMKEVMGPVGVRAMGHPNIFPNLWISTRALQLSLRLPRGPQQTEIWWFTFLPKDYSEEQRRMAMKFMVHSFGPAGMLEQDDGENWTYSTKGAIGRVARRTPQNLQMALGEDEMLEDPSGQKRIETRVNEHSQRWLYRCWAEWLQAETWDELKRTRSPVPRGRI